MSGTPTQCPVKGLGVHNYYFYSWPGDAEAPQCSITTGGPSPMHVIKVGCTRRVYGKHIRVVVTLPNSSLCAAEFGQPDGTTAMGWEDKKRLADIPVHFSGPEIRARRSGRENIHIEVTQFPEDIRLDDGTVDLEVTLR